MTPSQTDSGKHREALREHLQLVQDGLTRSRHHLHNAASEAAVIPGCEAWAPHLEEAQELCVRASELLAPLHVDDGVVW